MVDLELSSMPAVALFCDWREPFGLRLVCGLPIFLVVLAYFLVNVLPMDMVLLRKVLRSQPPFCEKTDC